MSQTAIPLEFEKYLQNKISLNQPTALNEVIFAMIPDLDLSKPIDRAVTLPSLEYWVHQQYVDQIGKSGSNAVVYSVVIPGSKEPFTFNAMFLRDDNVPNSCGMVVYKATETKEKGMALTKSMLMQFDGAASAANITVDAATWQIDYQARLNGIDEEHRLSCLDNYGHAAFVGGFGVARHETDQSKYIVEPGVAYIGGLRIQSTLSTVQTITNKPTTLWLDVFRDGTALSTHENLFQVVVSNDDLADYTDEDGRIHYVAKLASIEAGGTTVDLRVEGGLNLAEMKSNAATDEDIDNKSLEPKHVKLPQLWRGIQNLKLTLQFQEYNTNRKYLTGEICYTKNSENGELSYWQWYSNIESLAGKSPLLDANRHFGWTDNTKPFYWVPYTGDQVGMPFYWLDTSAPEWAVMEINVDLPIAVYWRLARRYPDLVNGSVINTGEIRAEFLRVLDQGRGFDSGRVINSHQRGSLNMGDDGNDAIGPSFRQTGNYADSHGLDHVTLNYLNEHYPTREFVSAAAQHIDIYRNSINYHGVQRPSNVARPMAIAI